MKSMNISSRGRLGKRLLVAVLTVAMLVTFMPGMAFADDPVSTPVTVDLSAADPTAAIQKAIDDNDNVVITLTGSTSFQLTKTLEVPAGRTVEIKAASDVTLFSYFDYSSLDKSTTPWSLKFGSRHIDVDDSYGDPVSTTTITFSNIILDGRGADPALAGTDYVYPYNPMSGGINFYSDQGSTLVLDGAVIQNCDYRTIGRGAYLNQSYNPRFGAGVCAIGNLVIKNSTITGNSIDAGGAGVCQWAELSTDGLEIIDSTFTYNLVYADTLTSWEKPTGGGAIYSEGPLKISGSTIKNNQARNSSRGGGILACSDVEIEKSTISENMVPDYGDRYSAIFSTKDTNVIKIDGASNVVGRDGETAEGSIGGSVAAPTAVVTYAPTTTTNGNVVATVTATEPVTTTATGWTSTPSDKTVWTKTYTKNTTAPETVVFKSIATEKTVSVDVKVENIDKTAKIDLSVGTDIEKTAALQAALNDDKYDVIELINGTTLNIDNGQTRNNTLTVPFGRNVTIKADVEVTITNKAGSYHITVNGLVPAGNTATDTSIAFENIVLYGQNSPQGFAYGGGIYFTSGGPSRTLTLDGAVVRNCTNNGSGGGISSYGNLILKNSEITGNTAPVGGGVSLGENSPAGYSGSLRLDIINSTISDNTASFDETLVWKDPVSGVNYYNGGGGVYAEGVLNITGSTITNNTSNAHGGGVLAYGDLDVKNSKITGNTLDDPDDGKGSAVFSNGSAVVIDAQSTIDGTIYGYSSYDPGSSAAYSKIVLNTEVKPLGQYPVSFELTLDDPSVAAQLTPADFSIDVTAWRNWSGSAQQPVNVPAGKAVLDLSLDGNVLTLYVSGFPERYYLMDAYTVNCTEASLTFTMNDIDDVVTPGMDRFSLIEGRATSLANGNDMQFNYYKFVPDNAGQEALPLVLYLHGSTDRWAIKPNRWVIAFAEAYNQQKNPSYVLAPQFEDNVTGRTTGIDSNTVIDETVKVIEQLITEGKVDPNRIYVAGKSMGGGNTYRAIDRHPDFFAGAFIACAANYSSAGTLTNALSNMPTWIFYSEGDSANIVSANRNIYSALAANGSTFMNKRTELSVEQVDTRLQNENHATELHVTESDVYIDWLYKQTKAPIAANVAYAKACANVTAQGQFITSIELQAKPGVDLSNLNLTVNNKAATVSVNGRFVTLSGFSEPANGEIAVAGATGFAFGKSGIRDIITVDADKFLQYSKGMSNGFNFGHNLYVPPVTPGTTIGARETRPLIVVLSNAADNLRDNRAVLAWSTQTLKASYVLAPVLNEANALQNTLDRVAYYRSVDLIDDVYITGDNAAAVKQFVAQCPDVKRYSTFTAAQIASDETAVFERLFASKVSAVTIDILKIIVDQMESTFPEADYTPGSWAPFGKALDDAKAIIATPDDFIDADVDAVLDALFDASDKLVRIADKSGLKMAIDYAENILKPANVGKYIPASITNLEDVLSGAAIVYADADATQAKVDKANDDLLKAIGQVYEKGDKARLQALVTLVSRYASASYTPASWATFTKVLNDARAVIDNPNAVADSVDKAYAALSAAITGLTRKADIAALNASIVFAQQIVDSIGDYVPSTVVGLAEELAAAKAVANNPDASQAQVNTAAASLNTKVLAARLKPDLSGLLSATARARAVEESLYTAESYKVLTTAVTGAEAVLGAPEKVTQSDVDGATQAVDSAIATLVPKTADIAGSDGKSVAKTVIPKGKVAKITVSAKGKIVVKWAKAPAAAKVTGYQVQYRVKGVSKWTTKTISAKSTSLTIKNLKKDKKYQIRVRAYRTGSGTNDCGAWSAVKISKRIK